MIKPSQNIREKVQELELDRIVFDLDRLFSIHDSEPDPTMARWVPKLYREIGFDFEVILQADFLRRYNGLMLRSGNGVKEFYCAAFPCPDVLEKLLVTAKGPALLFTHHPVDMEVSGRGFLPVSPDNLSRMKAQGISLYACHAPMDWHDSIGTNAGIVEAFGVRVERMFAPCGSGFAGRIGYADPTGLEELVKKGQEIFGVARVEIGGAKPSTITKVAIVAGGGDDPDIMAEAEQVGAQAFITGDWYTRICPVDPEARAWVEANRAACKDYAGSSRMAMLGFSHGATEFLVMKTQMTDYFRRQGAPVIPLPQADWWR